MAHDTATATGDTNTPLHFAAEDGLSPTKSMNQIAHNAKNATDKEHKMTLLQGIRLYPKAIAWSLLISTCICMEGYDVCLLSNFCKFPHRHYDGMVIVKTS
jgi:SP family general alpha glucoside:H+ symporter-like MFS transporter